MKIMVAYDGTLQSKEALVYGMEKAREKGDEVVALHVFNSNMFVDYDVMDAEAMARREAEQFVEDAKALIRDKGKGVRTTLFTTEGNPEQEVINFAKARQADVLLVPPRFKGIINKYQKSLGGSEFAGDAAKLDLAVLSTKTL